MKEILKNLIEFDTTMSRKNEKECANYIYQYFLERKIKVTMYEPAPNRCSVAAYIPGKRKEQLVVHAHIDTADYGKEKEWKFPPDIATEYKECIVGRGALDCKGLLAIWMKLFSELAKQSHTLERSILFLATADEESGGTYGIQWILQNTKIMEHTFLVIGEGGGYPLPYKDQILYTIQTGEIPPHYCKSESPNCNPEDILNKGIEKGF